MSNEESLKQQLMQKLNISEDKVRIIRPRRISLEIDYARFPEAFKIITSELKFNILSAITGLDEGVSLSVIYHVTSDNGTVLNLKIAVDKNSPIIRSVTTIFPSAEVYERELVDLLGFIVEGLPQGHRYPLTDDWPIDEFPLRKDWKPKG